MQIFLKQRGIESVESGETDELKGFFSATVFETKTE